MIEQPPTQPLNEAETPAPSELLAADEPATQPPAPSEADSVDGGDTWVSRLIEAARTGTELDLTSLGGSRDPAEADQWPAERTVPAAAIRTALLTRDLNADPHGLRLHGAHITGQLDFENATIPCELALGLCTFAQPILMNSSHLPALTLTGSHTPGLDLDQATIKGVVDLRHITTTGEISATGVTIGQLVMTGATLTNETGVALNLAGATVDGDVTLKGNLTATGAVRFPGATIHGHLVMTDATLTNETGDSLTLDGAVIAGGACLRNLTAIGEVRFPGATIHGQLVMTDATLTNKTGEALTLQAAKIDQLWLTEAFTVTAGTVNLVFADIGILHTHRRQPPPELYLTGWRLGSIFGPLMNDPQAAISWLNTVPKSAFAVQPWHEVAAVYERNGKPAEAKLLRYQAAKQVSPRIGEQPPPLLDHKGVRAVYRGSAQALRWLYKIFAGYGYYPMWAGIWLIGFCALAGLLVYLWGPVGVAAPPGFNPWLYGLATVAPPMSIIPTSWSVTDPLWLAWALVGLKGLGWVQTGLLLGTLTGLLKKG